MSLHYKTAEWSKIVGYPITSENQYKLWAMGAPRDVVEANELNAEAFNTLPNPFVKIPTPDEIQTLISDLITKFDKNVKGKPGRPITNKAVQVHFSCACGYNEVYHDSYPIRWKDFAKARIRRKIDKSTGLPFLLEIQKAEKCSNCVIN